MQRDELQRQQLRVERGVHSMQCAAERLGGGMWLECVRQWHMRAGWRAQPSLQGVPSRGRPYQEQRWDQPVDERSARVDSGVDGLQVSVPQRFQQQRRPHGVPQPAVPQLHGGDPQGVVCRFGFFLIWFLGH